MTNELIADGIYRVSGMETSLKNGAWVSDAGTYLVTNQTKLADIPDARPGDIAFTAGYSHIWQLDVDSTTWVELPKTAAGTAATQAAASATAAAGSASAAAASASQAQTVAASIPADYTSLSNSVVDLKSALTNETNARILLAGRVTTAEGDIDTLETHKVAQPLDEYNQPTNGTSGQSLRTKGDGTTEWADVGLPTDAQTAQAVSDWLDAHPEATTTVEDGSLVLNKIKPGELPFVTPEMFGAKGDGIVDDTDAWQDAVDSGYNVIATKSNYKCGQINISKNILIDCNHADFIATSERLFYCTGEVVTTLTSESNYTANQSDYAISGSGYTGYNGFAMLKGTNNFELSRTYYKGGFVCEFWNGKMMGSYPIDATGVSIEIINPITVHFANVGNIKHLNGTTKRSIEILYGFGCLIQNCVMPDTNAYDVIRLNCCLNCSIKNVSICQEYASGDNNSYLVSFANSSYCVLSDSYLFNKNWHCVTTGDTYLCYKNKVENCELYSNQVAIADHENALGTTVINSTCARITLSAMCYVENVTVVNAGSACDIRLYAISNKINAIYNVKNITFNFKAGTSAGSIGIVLTCSPQTSGNTYYFTKVNIEDAYARRDAQFKFSVAEGSNYVLYDVIISHSNLSIYGISNSALSVWDISKSVLVVVGFLTRYFNSSFTYPEWYQDIIHSDYNIGTAYLIDVKAYNIAGNYTNLYFSNLMVTQQMSAVHVSNEMRGTGLHSYFTPDVLLEPTKLSITDMKRNDLNTWYNIAIAKDGKRYYQIYESGSMVAHEITA